MSDNEPRPKRSFFGSARGALDRKATSRAERRAELVTRHGSDPDVIALIDQIVDAEREIAGTKKGDKGTLVERRKERRLWSEKRDKLIRKVEKLSASRADVRISKSDVDAAKAHLVALEALPNYEAVERYEAKLDREFGDYYETFRALLERSDPGWLSAFNAQIAAREDARINAEVERELAELGEAAFIAKYAEPQS